MLKALCCALNLVIGLTLTVSGRAAPMLSAGSATVTVGDVFVIPISVADATDLTSFQFDLSYDGALLNVVGFSGAGTEFESAATSGGGFLTGLTGFSLSGLLSGVADSMSGSFAGMSGTGVLVNIEFEALASGISALTLGNVFLNTADQGFAIANGQVCVNSRDTPCDVTQPVSEPGTQLLLLFFIAMVIHLQILRKRRSVQFRRC